jgi:hypothetical protein
MIELGAVRAILRQAGEAAHLLGDPGLIRLAELTQEHSAAPRLHLLLAGLSGSGRAAVGNALLASPGLLPTSAIPKAPADILIRFGPSPTAELNTTDGREAVPMARLRTGLVGPGSASVQSVHLQAPSEILKTSDLRIAAVDGGRSAEGWRHLLAGIDYVFLVLRAPALLSLSERDFIREHLVPFGLHRVAIVVNQIDLVDEEERPELGARVRDFLGPYERQPAILEMQATAAPAPESGYPELATLAGDLTDRHPELRRTALLQAALGLVALLEEAAEREAALAALGSEEIERVRESVDSRRDWLRERAERTQAHVRTTNTLTQERLLRTIDGFADVVRRRLPEEVIRVEDLSQIKRHVPGYLETIWSDFLQRQVLAVRYALLDEARALAGMVERDLEELLGDRPELLPAAALDLDVDALPTFVTPKRGRHRAESIIRALSVYGYFMLLFNPTSGVLALGIGQVVRKVFGGEITLSDKRAIAQSALNAMHNMETELKKQIGREFVQITADLQTEVARAYEEGIGHIDAFLREVAERQGDVQGTGERLARLQRTVLPELQQKLDALAGNPPATADVAG